MHGWVVWCGVGSRLGWVGGRCWGCEVGLVGRIAAWMRVSWDCCVSVAFWHCSASPHTHLRRWLNMEDVAPAHVRACPNWIMELLMLADSKMKRTVSTAVKSKFTDKTGDFSINAPIFVANIVYLSRVRSTMPSYLFSVHRFYVACISGTPGLLLVVVARISGKPVLLLFMVTRISGKPGLLLSKAFESPAGTLAPTLWFFPLCLEGFLLCVLRGRAVSTSPGGSPKILGELPGIA